MSYPDIGDKYSVFRQLEQPADKKPVGKKYIYVSHIHDSYNLIFWIGDTCWAL